MKRRDEQYTERGPVWYESKTPKPGLFRTWTGCGLFAAASVIVGVALVYWLSRIVLSIRMYYP